MQEFQIWGVDYDLPQNVVASFHPQKWKELLVYLSVPHRYRVYYYLVGTSWMIQVHDQYVDEQVFFMPVVVSVGSSLELPQLIENYF
jgi:hypothetical protein